MVLEWLRLIWVAHIKIKTGNPMDKDLAFRRPALHDKLYSDFPRVGATDSPRGVDCDDAETVVDAGGYRNSTGH